MKKSKKAIKPGLKYRGIDRDLWYIVTIISDDGNELVVTKSWNKWKQSWLYTIASLDGIQWILDNQDDLTPEKSIQWVLDHQDELKPLKPEE